MNEARDALISLKTSEMKSLTELRMKVYYAIVEETLVKPEKENKTKAVGVTGATIEEEEADETVDKNIELWGVSLRSSRGEMVDVILLKFLVARDFKVNKAFKMLKKTLNWRMQSKIGSILEEDFGKDFTTAAYMIGVDRESHPVCYNVHSKEIYEKAFGSETDIKRFIRWRFQLMEKGIHELDLKPNGVTSLLHIHDLKNSPGLLRRDLWLAIKNIIIALQDYYPEFVSRHIFINVPAWFDVIIAIISPFLSNRIKRKIVVGPASILSKYITAEEIPVEYGGFKRDNERVFSNERIVEIDIEPGSSHIIEISTCQTVGTLFWDILVLGWEVNYKEMFVTTRGTPPRETLLITYVKSVKKIGSNEKTLRNSFNYNEPGKIVLGVDNVSGKRKRVMYRSKVIQGI